MVSTLGKRVADIESTISTHLLPHLEEDKLVHTQLLAAQQKIVTDQGEILALISGAKKAGTFVARHGKHVLLFGAGLMSAAGIGNPEIWKFILHFFS